MDCCSPADSDMAGLLRQKVLWCEQWIACAEKEFNIAHDLWANVVEGRLHRGYRLGDELGTSQYSVDNMNSLHKTCRIQLDEVYRAKKCLEDSQKQLGNAVRLARETAADQ